MPISMQWEFKERKSCAHLIFEKADLPDTETTKKISDIIKYATSGGGPVSITNSIHKNNEKIFITKKTNVEWNKFRIAIEHAIQQRFSDAVFKDTQHVP